jgi:hypothetical protein
VTENERRAQIETNLKLYDTLRSSQHSPDFHGWCVVALFYAALHRVEITIGRTHGHNADSHKERNYLVKTLSVLRPVQREYRRLYDYSLRVRYEGDRPTTAELDGLCITYDTICQRLDRAAI